MTSTAPAPLLPPATLTPEVLTPTERIASAVRSRTHPSEDNVLRRVRTVWWLLFFNVLGAAANPVLHLPHRIGQALTQGALVVAVLLALTINRKVRIRPNIYLTVFTTLGATSLMSSVRLVSLGTDYRAFRLLAFIGVLWLLTPWWGRRDLLVLRSQIGFLLIIVSSVVLGIVVAHRIAMGAGRLEGAIWPIPATQVAHYSAELTGLSLILWGCRLMKGRTAVLIAFPSFAVLILSHTRTALAALALGLVIAFASLFTTRRRVRIAFTAIVLSVALVGVPLAPLVITWLARGESSTQLASLTGRTKYWNYVFAEQRTTFQKILGDGLSNGSVNGKSFSGGIKNVDGLSIDSSWVEDYQDQGLVGDALTGFMFIVLLVMAAFAPRGPRRALALFLVLYCLVASITEDGAGIASQYALDMTVAASLIVPEAARRVGKPSRPRLEPLSSATVQSA